MVNISRAEQLKTKPSYWKQQADIWQETDLTQSEYCWQHNLKDNQLTYVGYLPEVAGDGACFSTLLTPIQCLRLQGSSPKKKCDIDSYRRAMIVKKNLSGIVMQNKPYLSYKAVSRNIYISRPINNRSDCDSCAKVEQLVLRAESSFGGLSANIARTKWLKD